MTTSILEKTIISKEEKELLGGFEVKMVCNVNLSENAKKCIHEKMRSDSECEDTETKTYCVADGVVHDFLTDEDIAKQLDEKDIKILNIIKDKYHYFDV